MTKKPAVPSSSALGGVWDKVSSLQLEQRGRAEFSPRSGRSAPTTVQAVLRKPRALYRATSDPASRPLPTPNYR